jgi:PAS domain S-box-containing protein
MDFSEYNLSLSEVTFYGVFGKKSCCKLLLDRFQEMDLNFILREDLELAQLAVEEHDHGPRFLVVSSHLLEEKAVQERLFTWAHDQFVYLLVVCRSEEDEVNANEPFEIWSVSCDAGVYMLKSILKLMIRVYLKEAAYRTEYVQLQQHTEFQKEYINLKSRELDDNARFMRRLVDFLPVPMFFRNTRHEYVFWNRALENILGSVINCFQDTQLESMIDAAIEKLGQTESSNKGGITLEVEMRFTDGEVHPILFSVAQFSNPWDDGGGNGILGCLVDISDQKIAEKQKENQFNLLRTVIDLLPDFIYAKDLESRFILANKEVADNLGVEKPSDLIGKTDHEFFDASLADIYRADELRVMKSGVSMPQIIELTKDSRTGQDKWLHTRKVPYFDSEGNIIGVVGSGTDITPIKKMQNRLIQLENIINSSRMIASLISMKENRKVKYISEGVSRYGYRSDDFYSGKMIYSDLFHPDDKEKMEKDLQQASKLQLSSEKEEHRLITANGEVVWVESMVELLYDSDRVLSHIQIVTFDISDRKKAEEESKMMQVRLRQAEKMESIGQLAAGIAHEINSPIQFIGDNTVFFEEAWSYISKIIREDQLNDDLKFYYDEIPKAIKQSEEGIERVTRIVEAMREFSHPGAKKMSYADMNNALEQAATVCRNSWKYHCDLVTDFDSRLPTVFCDVSKMNQCFLNIIVNAAHAVESKIGSTPKDKGKITLTTRVVDEDRIYIGVADTGCGIPDEHLDRIFEPFFTTKDVGKGTGQGLSLCYDTIVRQHHGELSVESEVGKGSLFNIYLKIKANDE